MLCFRSLNRKIARMVKPWLSSTPLKIRTIHDILCEIIEKEGEYKYTVINKRKHLLSFFTFEEIFIAAQLYTCFIDNDLKSIVENSQVGHAFSKVNKNLGDNVSTGDEVKTPPIKFVQVLQERVPDFFEMSSYDLQRDVFNLAFLTMICKCNTILFNIATWVTLLTPLIVVVVDLIWLIHHF